MKVLLVTALLVVAGGTAEAQSRAIAAQSPGHSLGDVIEHLKKKTGHEFIYRKDILDEKEIANVSLDDASLEETLEKVFRARGYDYEIVDNVVVLKKSAPRAVASAPQGRVRVQGVVKHADGTSLPGATVRIKGGRAGAAADENGKFEISFANDKNVVLVFSFVGMEEREIRYTGQKEMIVVLKEKPELVDDVIVIGYSARKTSELTGSVQHFRGDEVAGNTVGGNLMNALRGHTTGLQITGNEGRPGSDGDLLLRGLGTLYGVVDGESQKNVFPLIVIDGVITDYTSLSGVIAPSDVADITVLKDAASTAIYGSRAATGVIVITTKKGRPEEMTLSVNLNVGASVPHFGGLKTMTSPELLEFGKTTLRNWWKNNQQAQDAYPNEMEKFVDSYVQYIQDHYDLTKTTNWRDLLYRTGRSLEASLSLQGGGDKTRYYFSYNYLSEQGTRIGYELKRHMLRIRLDHDINRYLCLGTNISGAFSNPVSPTVSGSETSYHPWASPFNADGSLAYSIPNKTDFDLDAQDNANPLLDGKYNNAEQFSHHLSGSFYGTLKPLPWLSFTSTNTVTLSNSGANVYNDSRTYSGNNSWNQYSNGTLSISESSGRSFLTSNILRLQFSLGDDHLSGLIGQEWYERWGRSWGLSMYDQRVPGERNLGGFSKAGDKLLGNSLPSGSEVEAGSFSIFSEVHYTRARRYIASLSFRNDASTNFGKKKRNGNFYSASASWVASEEEFMRDQEWISHLKFRASYGTSGKEAGRDHLNYTLYSTGDGDMDNMYNYYSLHPVYQASYIAAIEQLGNERLSWETAHNLNVGVDVALFDERVQLSVDKYRRVNSDLIMEVTLSAANGVGRQYRNVGEMINSGVEVVLNTHNIKGDFNWSSNFTFSYNKNKLSKLDNGQLVRSGNPTLRVGENISSLKKIKVNGIDPETGKIRYERVDPDKVTLVNTIQEVITGNDDRSYVNVGLSRAPYWGGFTNTFSWKNWQLEVNTSYSFGYKVLNNLKKSVAYDGGWRNRNVYRLPSAWKVWGQPGDKADLPAPNTDPSLSLTEHDLYGESSLLYTRADHWRVSSIRLEYALPGRCKTWGFRDATVHFLMDNVYTFTSKEFAGYDPENTMNWAAPRRFILGFNFTF
jgi:TonB-linked SusC/RagA family outer membrane protein